MRIKIYKNTKTKLEPIKDKLLVLLLENNIRGGISSVLGDRYVEYDFDNQILYIDENNLYGLGMSQYLPTSCSESTNLIQKITNPR